jgi:hypothetical protein
MFLQILAQRLVQRSFNTEVNGSARFLPQRQLPAFCYQYSFIIRLFPPELGKKIFKLLQELEL